jgi:hypothetical protein
MPDESTLIAAADLAERILDEVSSAAPDWAAVEHMADALARVAARLQAPQPGRPEAPPPADGSSGPSAPRR